MRTTIYWFSGTGNSLAAARKLAGMLGECRVEPMAGTAGGAKVESDTIGLVFPVYSFGPPLLVESFIDRLEAAPDSYIFAVATNGGLAGSTLRAVRARLRRRGLALAAGWSLRMPGNCIYLYGAWKEASRRKAFQKAAARLPLIAQAVRERRRGPVEGLPRPFSWLFDGINASARKHYLTKDSFFRVTDRCTSCGLCERICPVGDIRMESGRPVWLGACQQCYACIQWCPVEAIQIGRRTEGRARYRHPEVTADDLCVRRGEG